MWQVNLLQTYILRIAVPTVLLLTTAIAVGPNQPMIQWILFVYSFALMRDAMIPTRVWTVGAKFSWTTYRFTTWIRFAPAPVLLLALGLSSGFMVALWCWISPSLAQQLVWLQPDANFFVAIIAGVAASFIVFAPIAAMNGWVAPMPGNMSLPKTRFHWAALLTMCVVGNCLEEALYRGFFQGLVQTEQYGLSPQSAAAASGLAFCITHMHLATTVTDAGVPLLLFTLWEGSIAAIMQMHFGLIAATLTHGLAIFQLTALPVSTEKAVV